MLKLAGEAARWIGRLRRVKRDLDPKLDETDPIPLTWRAVEHQRSQERSSVAAAKAAAKAAATKPPPPPSSRYD